MEMALNAHNLHIPNTCHAAASVRTASLACISKKSIHHCLNESSDSRCTWALIQKSIVYIGNSQA